MPAIGTDAGAGRAYAWLASSARAEQVAASLAVVAGAALLVAACRRREAATRLDVPSPALERVLLAGILLAAAVARLALGSAPWQPRWYFSESTVMWAARTLASGDFAQFWLATLRNTQGVWTHESAVMFPSTVAAQLVLGPSDHLPLVVGAAWGVLAVGLAWVCGRTLVSPAFGLAFAAFVAAAPVQITWSRIGGLYIGSVVHVLAVVWVGYQVGRRGSVLGAAALGVLAWISVYHYFAARVALPLAPLALLVGRRGRQGIVRTLVLLVVFAATLGAAFAVVQWAGGRGLWPSYTGYVGSRGEASVREMAVNALRSAQEQTQRAIAAYFWRDRIGALLDFWGLRTSPWAGTARAWGMANGGLVLLPVTLLGLVGLAAAVRHCIRDAVWLAMAALGLALTALSVPSSRRFLVFDLAWCAFAARGLLLLLDVRPLARLAPAARIAVLVAVPAVLGAWTCATLALLWRPLPSNGNTPMPFGESGFGDGLTCLGCIENGRRWQHDIAAGALVVLFDPDMDRENPTVPSGLLLYGKLGAQVAGHPDRFVEFYATLQNHELELPYARALYDARQLDPVGFLATRIEQERPAEIVWHFVAPTAWERALAARLLERGGVAGADGMPNVAPLGVLRPPALRVRTPWERRDDAIAAVRDVLGTGRTAPPACVAVDPVATWSAPWHPMLLGTLAPAADGTPPRWATAGWHEVLLVGASAPPMMPGNESVALTGDPARSGGLLVLRRDGAVAAGLPGAPPDRVTASALPLPVGRDCGVYLAGAWYAVDPIVGGLAVVPRPAWPLPPGLWVGLAAMDPDHLVLVAADQRVQVLDVRTGTIVASVATRVPPSRRWHYGECVPVAAGPEWIATLDHLRATLTLVSPGGGAPESVRVSDLVRAAGVYPSAISGSGKYLAVAWNQQVSTLALTPRPECRAAAPAP